MKRGSLVAGLVFGMVIGVMVYSSPAQAQWWKRGGNKEKKEQLREQLKEKVEERIGEIKEKVKKKMETGSGGGPEFGFYYPALAAVNNHITTLGTFPALEGGFFIGGTWRYSITPELQIGYYGGGAGYSTTGQSTGSETWTTGINLGINFQGGLIAFKPRISENFRLYGGVIVGAVWTTYKEDSGYRPSQQREVKEWAGVGAGYLPFIGFQIKLNPLFGFGADYGYMIASIPSAQMKPQAGTPYSEKCPDIELNGSFVKFGPQFRF